MATTNTTVLPIKQGTENLGKPYERQVIAYLAATLDGLNSVQNFHISGNTEGVKIFEDIIIKCSYVDALRKDGYFFQIKHSKKDLLLGKGKCKRKEYAVVDMKDAAEDVKKMSPTGTTQTFGPKTAFETFIEDIDDRYFYIFTNMKKIDTEVGTVVEATHSDYNPLVMLVNEKIHKCNTNANEFEKMFIVNSQPDFYNIDTKILQTLGSKFTADMVINITDDIYNYMNNITNCNVMNRKTFQCICLEQLISSILHVNISTTRNMNDRFYKMWESIFMIHNLTIIEDRNDLLPLLAHYYERKIKEIDETFSWEKCKENNFQLSDFTKLSFRRQFSININKKINSLKDLLVLMWWVENWPLIIRTPNIKKCLDILNQYKHLNKKCLLLVNINQRLCLPDDTNVFQNVSDISSKEIREEINNVLVSLQGRPRVPLVNIVGSSEKIWEAVTASHILEWSKEEYVPLIGHYSQNRKDDYIKRCFHKKSMIYTEEEVVEDVANQFHFSVIANETGMGKSTVLHSLSLAYDPKNLIALVNLADLKDLHKWKKQWKSPYDYFYDKIQPTDDKLYRAIFKEHQSTERLCLFLDSFNEILAAHEVHIKAILDNITQSEGAKLIMTTRTQATDLLNQYSVNYVELVKFNQNEINAYCVHNKVPIDQPLINNHQMLSNALHLSILPTVYKKLSTILNWDITDLYKEFILVQLDKYICEKKGITSINDDATIGMSIRRDLLDAHHKLSLISGFKQSKLIDLKVLKPGEFDQIKNEFLTFKNSLGLVSSIDDKGKVKFIHSAYGDYLRAEWFYRNSKTEIFSELYVMLLESHFLGGTVHLLNMMANSRKNCAIIAIINGDYDAIDNYIQAKDDCLFKPDDLGRYPIHIAAWYSKNPKSRKIFKEIHKYIQEYCNRILTENDNFNLTWINYMQAGTTDFDLPEKIKKEIDDGAEVNNIFVGYDHNLFDRKIFPSDMNVLHYAISFTMPADFIKYLLDQGADRYEIDNGRTALQIAISDGKSPEILKILLSYRADSEAIRRFLHSKECMRAAVSSKSMFAYEIFEVLIDCGMEPNLIEKDDRGRSCLHYAASSPSDDAYKIIELLLSCGMSLYETDINGRDVRYYSTLSSSENANKIVQLLINKGMDISEPDSNGMNYFHHVVLSNSPISFKNAKLLLDRKIDPGLEDNQRRNSLHLAALSGSPNSYKTVKLLLDHRMDPTKQDKFKRNAIHHAVLSLSENAHKTVELLLNYNINLNECDEAGKNALHYAILSQSENAYKVVQLLLKQNIDPNITDKDGKSCIHYEEFFESKFAYKILELLLQYHLNPNITDKNNKTCLHYENLFYSENARKIIELLLRHGLNPNLSDVNGRICLHNENLYESENARKMIKLLLKYQLNPNHTDNEGKTCLHNEQIYYKDKSRNVVELLLNHNLDANKTDKDGKNCLHYETLFYADNAREMIKLLLRFGLNVTKTDGNGNNCLHCEHIHYSDNSRKMVELLLEHGLNPNQTNNEGKICLHYPALYYSENARKMAELLLKNGLDPNTLDGDGKNCLHYKDLYSSEYARNMVQLLLEKGLDPNKRDSDGNHCLQYALHVDNFNEHVCNMVDLLCQYLDFTQTNLEGKTYLHDVASSNSENAHKILATILKNCHNLNQSDIQGRTAVHHAALSSSPTSYKMVELLLDNPEVNVKIIDCEGNTCLHYACSSGSENIPKTVKMLLERNVDPTIQNMMGKTCLHNASASYSPKAHKVVKRLVKCGLNPDKRDVNGTDCYFYASLSKSTKADKIKAKLSDCKSNHI